MDRIRWAVNCTAWRPMRESSLGTRLSHTARESGTYTFRAYIAMQEWLTAVSCVQKEEKERISKFVFCRDAKLALVGRLLIRSALVRCLGVENDSIVLGRTQKGRPVVVEGGDTTIDFNVSHQGKYAVLATEMRTQVGVDVMELSQPRGQSLSEFFHTMRRQFTSAEWEVITAQPTEKQLAMFYRFWCLKECFIKAEGSGLSYGLQKLEFVPGDGWPPLEGTLCIGSRLFIEGCAAQEWAFEESMLDEHSIAVAVRSPCASSYKPGPSFSVLTVPHLISTLHSLHPPCSRDWENFIAKEET